MQNVLLLILISMSSCLWIYILYYIHAAVLYYGSIISILPYKTALCVQFLYFTL